MSVCQGCAAQLPLPKAPGRERKWCSERCRKRACYSGTCLDCGVPTYNGEAVPSVRCVPCANKLIHAAARDAHEAFREEVEAVWAEGLSIREMAAVFERTPGSMSGEICRMRAAGANLPRRHKWTAASLKRVSDAAKATRARERGAA